MRSIHAPIGVFDSGLGGASVLREALRLLPTENYIYYGDNAHAPYGDRPEAEITALTLACIHKLVDMGCKAILWPAIPPQPTASTPFARN